MRRAWLGSRDPKSRCNTVPACHAHHKRRCNANGVAMADNQAPYDWRTLQTISYALDSNSRPIHAAFPFRSDLDSAIASALRSGKVPIRGKRGNNYSFSTFGNAFELIEPGPKASVDISLNRVIIPAGDLELRLRPRVSAGVLPDFPVAYIADLGSPQWFLEVEADYVAVKRWLLENALPASFTLDKCCLWLAMLPEHPRLTKKVAFEKFKTEHERIGANAFDRAWSEAAPRPWHDPGHPRGK